MKAHRAMAMAALIAAAAWAAPALAHAHLESSTITDGAELAAAPDQMSLTFDEPVALAGVSLTTDAGADIALEFVPARETAAAHAVDLPALEPGGYAFTWRALGGDGHPMTGTINFRVTGEADAQGTDSDPDAEPGSASEEEHGRHEGRR